MQQSSRSWAPRLGLILGPLLFALVLMLPAPEGMPAAGHRAAAAVLWIATWWVTEAIPIPATSLMPLLLFPLLGVIPAKATAANYGNDAIYLFLGGFLLAIAIERSGLHRRIAVGILRAAGPSPSRAVAGFILASAALSMWISNTATTLLMLPIAMAVVDSLDSGLDSERARVNLGVSVFLGVAYGASIGGLATPVGTPPNLVLMGIYGRLYPDAPPITFASWMATMLPLTLVLLPVCWVLLTRVLHPVPRKATLALPTALGPMTRDERLVSAVFALTALAWVFRKGVNFGVLEIPGWSSLWGEAGKGITDATVAIAAGVVLFLLPSGQPDRSRLLQWSDTSRIPWGVLLLFGGGFAVANACEKTGVSAWVGQIMQGLSGLPLPLVILLIVLIVMSLTELTSNTATTTVLLPIAAGVAVSLGLPPLTIMLPVTLAASLAFMLPVATPPNAIVYGSGRVSMQQMIRAGVSLNLMASVLVVAVVMWLAPLLLL